MRQIDRVHGALLAGVLFISAGPAPAQTTAPAAPQPATPAAQIDTLSSVDIVAPKRKTGIEALLPGTDQAKSATCEVLVSRNPSLLAELQVALTLQDPLMGPTILLPTRKPRNPDLTAPPITAPGSALPELTRGRRQPLDNSGQPADILGSTEVAASDDGTAAFDTGGATEDFTSAAAVSLCRTLFTRGNSASPATARDARGRAEIARYNKNMPMGFELFDHGRYEEALAQFKEAYGKLSDATGGDEAALMIGKIYLLGLGAKADPKEAVVWLKRSANAPFSVTRDMPVFDPLQPENNTPIGEAAVMLGNLYLKGSQGIPKDPDEARKWFARAAYVGHVPANKVLGDLYFSGYDTPRDAKKAMQYYQTAATLNLGAAQVALADIYYAGAPGVPADLQKALGWYNQAAKQEQPGGLYALAVAFDTGEGVAADPEKALGFYKTAALKGHPDAQAALGSYFYEGDRVAKDLVTARQWFEMGANGGNPDAMFNLGVMAMKGEGGPKDLAKAWVWLKLASRGGVPQAPAAIAAAEARMTPEEKQAAAKLYVPTPNS